jgi:hypothetical protein
MCGTSEVKRAGGTPVRFAQGRPAIGGREQAANSKMKDADAETPRNSRQAGAPGKTTALTA